MRKVKVYVQKSFSITGRGIIVEIQHNQAGLISGTELISTKTNLSWKVVSRILFSHAIDKQIHFEGESLNYASFSFESVEKKEESIRKMIENEKRRIFQYMIKPVGHDQKPEDGEELEIKADKTTGTFLKNC